MRTIYAVIAAVTLWTLSASAQSDQDPIRLKNAMNNEQQDAMECAAYYMDFAVCLAVSDKQKSFDEMRTISDQFFDRGIKLGQAIGMTEDAMVSRFKMAQQDQLILLNSSCVNISSLISRYDNNRCNFILRDIKAAVNQYMRR